MIREFIASNRLNWTISHLSALRMLLNLLEWEFGTQTHFAGNFMIGLLQGCVALKLACKLTREHRLPILCHNPIQLLHQLQSALLPSPSRHTHQRLISLRSFNCTILGLFWGGLTPESIWVPG